VKPAFRKSEISRDNGAAVCDVGCCSKSWLVSSLLSDNLGTSPGSASTDGCNDLGRHNFLSQKLKAGIVSMVSVHCCAHRLASACCYTAADLYSMVYETAKVLYCNYGIALLLHCCDRFAWRCIRLQRKQKVGSCNAHAK